MFTWLVFEWVNVALVAFLSCFVFLTSNIATRPYFVERLIAQRTMTKFTFQYWTGTECVFKNVCLNVKICWCEINHIWVIFTHLKLWVAVARHNFKWVKILMI